MLTDSEVTRKMRLLYISKAIDFGLTFDYLRQFVDSNPVAARQLFETELGTFSLGKWLIKRHRIILG
jgi:hypothetical protein